MAWANVLVATCGRRHCLLMVQLFERVSYALLELEINRAIPAAYLV